MARADLILNLVRASRLGDDLQVRKTVEALAANERAKNHTVLADRLLAQLQIENRRGADATAPTDRFDTLLVTEKIPCRRLDELVLAPLVEETMRELVTEHHRADLLRSYNLEPRNRILLSGPPGNCRATNRMRKNDNQGENFQSTKRTALSIRCTQALARFKRRQLNNYCTVFSRAKRSS